MVDIEFNRYVDTLEVHELKHLLTFYHKAWQDACKQLHAYRDGKMDPPWVNPPLPENYGKILK